MDLSNANAESPQLTKHALTRMNSRRISREAVIAAITYGRVIYAKGAQYFVIGRNEAREYGRVDPNVRRYEGLQVVCVNNRVLTVFRNHDFSGIRKYKPRPHVRWKDRGHSFWRTNVVSEAS